MPGFIQLLPGTDKSDRPINITALHRIHKIHLKADCLDGSIVNGTREPTLYSFGLDKPPGHETYKEPRIKLSKYLIKSLLSDITFYLDDGDHKPVDCLNETITFTCQLIKI